MGYKVGDKVSIYGKTECGWVCSGVPGVITKLESEIATVKVLYPKSMVIDNLPLTREVKVGCLVDYEDPGNIVQN